MRPGFAGVPAEAGDPDKNVVDTAAHKTPGRQVRRQREAGFLIYLVYISIYFDNDTSAWQDKCIRIDASRSAPGATHVGRMRRGRTRFDADYRMYREPSHHL